MIGGAPHIIHGAPQTPIVILKRSIVKSFMTSYVKNNDIMCKKVLSSKQLGTAFTMASDDLRQARSRNRKAHDVKRLWAIDNKHKLRFDLHN